MYIHIHMYIYIYIYIYIATLCMGSKALRASASRLVTGGLGWHYLSNAT